MKSFLLVLLGMLGAGALSGGLYGYFTDGGLARLLYDLDRDLSALPAEKRTEILETWQRDLREHVAAKAAKEAAAAAASENSPSASPAPTPTRPALGAQPMSTSPAKGDSALSDDLAMEYRTLHETFDAAVAAWKVNRSNTRPLAEVLKRLAAHLHRVRQWSAKGEEGAAAIHADNVQRDILANFTGGKSLFGLARSQSPEIDGPYKQCRDAAEALKRAG